MIIELRTLEREHPAVFRKARADIIQSSDEFKREKYYFTLAEKEDWLSFTSINIVLRQSQEGSDTEYFLFFEKTVTKRDELGLIPSCKSTKLIRLNRIKLVARKKNCLVIVYLSEQQKLEQLNIRFACEQISRKWQNLIYSKKNQRNQVDNNDRGNLADELKQTKVRLRFCEDQLIQERRQKDEILKCLSIVTEQLNHCKSSNSLLENQINQATNRTSIGNITEVDRRLQQRQKLYQMKQIELLHLNLRIQDLQRDNKSIQGIFQTLESQKNGYQRQITQLLKKNQHLRGNIKRLQQEKRQMMDKILERNHQLRSNNISPSRSVFISNRQDLLRSFENQESMLSLGP